MLHAIMRVRTSSNSLVDNVVLAEAEGFVVADYCCVDWGCDDGVRRIGFG